MNEFQGGHLYLSFLLDSPDSFNPEKEVLELDDDEKLTLNCSTGGNPPPQYSWSSPQVQEIENQPLFSPLSAGWYTCTAFNILGKSSKQFIIKHKSIGKTNTNIHDEEVLSC